MIKYYSAESVLASSHWRIVYDYLTISMNKIEINYITLTSKINYLMYT
jgi:hypothetical protein